MQGHVFTVYPTYICFECKCGMTVVANHQAFGSYFARHQCSMGFDEIRVTNPGYAATTTTE